MPENNQGTSASGNTHEVAKIASNGDLFSRLAEKPSPYQKVRRQRGGIDSTGQILHHKTADIPRKLSPKRLHSLAILADKYFCEAAVFPWAVIWMQEHLERLQTPRQYELLYSAYILDLHDAFDKISRQVLVSNTADSLLDFAEHDLLQGNILREVKARHTEMLLEVNECIDEALEDVRRKRCTGKGDFMLRIHRTLHAIGVWPLSTASRSHSISQICDMISNVRLVSPPAWKNEQNQNHRRPMFCYDSRSGHRIFKASLEAELSKLTTSMRGLCLDCLKTKGASAMEANCLVFHEGCLPKRKENSMQQAAPFDHDDDFI
ncbi:hypothetical protein AJ79_07952 [Helicocarpus griseus UAMH5409]|uniref:Uncharacterized protein n=1 Tax=Helicocarpus griseus UAMH5409 TaxID=1447875 RepID=A0A2B7WXA0_9EURO|nr:hypothetical protein AJ79_07952 [Helicocarpus griseus UAMH5409]